MMALHGRDGSDGQDGHDGNDDHDGRDRRHAHGYGRAVATSMVWL